MAYFIYAGDGGAFKTCTKCGECKPLCEFRTSPAGLAGRRADCRKCGTAANAEYRIRNPNSDADWRSKNREKVNASARKWRSENPGAAKEAYDRWFDANRDAEIERRRNYRAANISEIRERQRADRAKNPEKHREKQRRFYAKNKDSAKRKLDNGMCRSIHSTITRGSKGGRSWEVLVGYTSVELIAHIESLFLPGMTWDNYGRHGWHIDHIIPKSKFNYQTPDHIDFGRCWSLANLQPLWAYDNLSKKDRLTTEFQPSLAI
ncbi:hypothetical protein [Shinella sp.]|uniref:hypothetical protein n=1 Tax=Shinella sp. TaxID=1870904 RepID=UPI0025842458|nr:hypothetical protein [Shinella sp.]MCW5706753.1 hypothetical protein [Shinella sp.]